VEGDTPFQEPHASRRLDPRATFLAYTHLNFGNTPLIASIVISLSRACLPNDEGPAPPKYFFLEPPLLVLIGYQRQFAKAVRETDYHYLRRVVPRLQASLH